jgi:3-hydroxy-9,10-secoandrosta-1,3,5(10)-triene-9,17-dione monooxygenase
MANANASVLDAAPGGAFRVQEVPALLESVRALRPMLARNAPLGETQRSPTAEVVEALNMLGIFTLLTPTRWRGGGISSTAFAEVQIELAKGDPAVAWVSQILNCTTWVATTTSDALQEDLFGGGPLPICGAYNPPGRAIKVDGGYRVSGSWPYCSGSRQARWVQGGALLQEENGGVISPIINFVYMPIDDIEIKDSWFVTGLQGTGSDTAVARDVFVPGHRLVSLVKPFGYVEPEKRHYGAPSDHWTLIPFVRATGLSLLVGAAEQMLDIIKAEIAVKPLVTTIFKTKSESHVVLHALGRTAAQIDTARTLLFEATMLLDNAALAQRKFSPIESARHKAQCAQVVELIHSAIEQVMFTAGSSAFALSNPLQRYWRDLHVAFRHVANLPQIGYEIYGRDLAGVTPNLSPPGAY